MAAKASTARHPIQAIHPGVSKSKAENATSVQPTASATCIATLDPLPSNTWVNTATGRANKRTIDPRKPRRDRLLELPNVPCCVATLGIVPTPPAPSGSSRSSDETLWRGKQWHTVRTTGLGYRVLERRQTAAPSRVARR